MKTRKNACQRKEVMLGRVVKCIDYSAAVLTNKTVRKRMSMSNQHFQLNQESQSPRIFVPKSLCKFFARQSLCGRWRSREAKTRDRTSNGKSKSRKVLLAGTYNRILLFKTRAFGLPSVRAVTKSSASSFATTATKGSSFGKETKNKTSFANRATNVRCRI